MFFFSLTRLSYIHSGTKFLPKIICPFIIFGAWKSDPPVTIKPKFSAIDEKYSTIEADEKLKETGLSYEKRKEIIDEMAAVVILERYLQKVGK